MSFFSSGEFILDTRIYQEGAIKQAAEKYGPYCNVRVLDKDGSKLKIKVIVNDEFKEREEYIKSELLNYLLGHSIRMRRG